MSCLLWFHWIMRLDLVTACNLVLRLISYPDIHLCHCSLLLLLFESSTYFKKIIRTSLPYILSFYSICIMSLSLCQKLSRKSPNQMCSSLFASMGSFCYYFSGIISNTRLYFNTLISLKSLNGSRRCCHVWFVSDVLITRCGSRFCEL